MKQVLTMFEKDLLKEYKDKHFDWVIRMASCTLKSMLGRIKFVEFPPNYSLQYRDSNLVDRAELSSVTSRLRIEIEAADEVLVDLLDKERFQVDDDMNIAGVVCLLERVELDLDRSESVISHIVEDPQDFMDELSTCIKLLKFHLELFTVSNEALG